MAEVVQSVTRVPRKRSRNAIAMAVIEVSQDELMKNRPREDQVIHVVIIIAHNRQLQASEFTV